MVLATIEKITRRMLYDGKTFKRALETSKTRTDMTLQKTKTMTQRIDWKNIHRTRRKEIKNQR